MNPFAMFIVYIVYVSIFTVIRCTPMLVIKLVILLVIYALLNFLESFCNV